MSAQAKALDRSQCPRGHFLFFSTSASNRKASKGSACRNALAFRHNCDRLRTIGLSMTEDMMHPMRTWLARRIGVPEPVESYFLQGFHRLPLLSGMSPLVRLSRQCYNGVTNDRLGHSRVILTSTSNRVHEHVPRSANRAEDVFISSH
jgi:hypothetical protein